MIFRIACFAQKVEWLDEIQNDVSGQSEGIQALHIQNQGKVYFQDQFFPPIVFHGQAVGKPYYNMITAYDTVGKFQWLKPVNPNGDNDGGVFMAGPSGHHGNFYYYSHATNNYTQSSGYLSEMDSLGNNIWTRKIIDTGGVGIEQIKTDDSGNVYMLMGCSGSSFVAQGKTYSCPANENTTFIIKADSEANIKWVKSIISSTDGEQVLAMCPDKNGNIYFYGCTYGSTVMVQGKTYISYYALSYLYNGIPEYIGKLNNNGSYSWFHFFDDDFNGSDDCDVDGSGNLYVKMYFGGGKGAVDTADLGGLKLSPRYPSTFLVKFDSSGKPLWATGIPQIQSLSPDDGGGVCLDHHGNCYMADDFRGTIFTGRDTVKSGTSLNNTGLYINKYDSAGVLQWSKIFKTNPTVQQAQVVFSSISADDNGTVYFTGSDTGNTNLDGFALKASVAKIKGYRSSLFVGKLGYPPVYLPDSMSYVHTCGSKIYYFHLYYYTTPDSMVWSFGDGLQSRQFQPMHSYLKSGIYIVKVTAYVHGLVKSFSDTINYINFPSRLLPKDTTLCPNSVLNVNTTVQGVTSYLWNNGDTMANRIISQAGFYKITVSGGGCAKSDSFNLVYDNHSFNLGKDTILCQGDTLVLSAPNWQNAKYSWSNSSSNPLLFVTAPGIYSLNVYDGTCHFADTINIKYDLFPSRILPADTVICKGHSVLISIKDFYGTIQWQDNKSDSNYVISNAGTYTVTLKNQCGQRTYSSVIADSNCNCYLFAPNAFTPNRDQHNDLFHAVTNCELESFIMRIYNRWGERIFQSEDVYQGWDGVFKQLSCPEGVYIYEIFYKFAHYTEQVKTGTVLLIR